MRFLTKKQAVSIVFIVTFFLTYGMNTLFLFLYFNLSLHHSYEEKLIKYQQRNASDLTKIYTKLFAEATSCENLPTSNQSECEEKVKIQLAETLHEEDLKVSEYDWPHDLTFVVHRGNAFYQLGWNGRVVTITKDIHTTLLDSHIPESLQFLTRNCGYFDPSVCEVYVKMNLPDRVGYMIRQVPLQEELDFAFIGILLPILAIVNFNTSFAFTLLIPLVLSIVAAFTYNQISRRKKGKK